MLLARSAGLHDLYPQVEAAVTDGCSGGQHMFRVRKSFDTFC